MAYLQAGIEAALLCRFDGFLAGAEAVALGDEGRQLRILRRQLGGERMMGRQATEGSAVKRIGPGGEDLDALRAPDDRKADQGALGAADPVALHQAHLLRPALHPLEGGQQLLGEVGDAEEPLGKAPPLDQRPGTPTPAIDHLLIGKYRVIHRVPVHPGLLALDETGLQEVEENRLLMLVVFRIAGRKLAGPVDGEPHHLELVAHRRDVGVGPLGRMDATLARRVLGRQAEGIPAHGVHDVEATRPLVAGDDVADRIVAHMAHVDAPRGIGEHLEDIVLWSPVRFRRAVSGHEAAGVLPGFLPSAFCFFRVVAAHDLISYPSSGRRGSPDGGRLPSSLLRGPALSIQPASQFSPAMRSWRARVRIASSISRPLVSELGASIQVPPSRTCRKTVARTPSARRSLPRMSRLTLKRSFGVSGGVCQSVMMTPPKGSAEASGRKLSVSRDARQR